MASVLAACGGFLMAVLWMDLMFDVQIRRPADRATTIASIAAYYRRVTTDAFPMNRLIAAVMLTTLVGSAAQTLVGGKPATLVTLMLGTAPIALALTRIVPAAVRLGARTDPPAVQDALARAIWREHVLCFLAMTAFTVLELRM